MGEETDWKQLAIEKQFVFFETLGTRPYDEIEKSNVFLLKKKVGFASCGKPTELPNNNNYYTGYTDENLLSIKSICDKIIEKSDNDPIQFGCTILILFHKGEICQTPVFRINSNTGNIFIDVQCRVYKNWNNFISNNKLPDCEYCCPVNGVYHGDSEFLVSFHYSPANKLFNKAIDCLDTVGTVASVAAASVMAVGLFVTVAPIATIAATTTAACTGVYSITRSAKSLYDRKKHEQPINLKDSESRSAWLSIASSAVGVVTMQAIGKAQKVYESGKALSKASVVGLHVLTASSVVFSGFGFVETLIICADKCQKGTLTKQDVFGLSCELLFLFNAIASAKATTQLVNNMSTSVAEASLSQRKLTKTQKRNLRKRAAKRRAKGLSLPVKEDPKKPSSTGFTTAVQLIFVEAVRAYAPRLEEIRYIYQSIGHDAMCWKMNEISDFQFLKNTARHLLKLYNDYKNEISEVIEKIKKYFSSLTIEMVKGHLQRLFETASEELKCIFGTKVINMEDQMDAIIIESEEEINELQTRLGIENDDELAEDITDDNTLNIETQKMLSSCEDIIAISSWSCNDLKEFGEILDGVKHILLCEFKERVSNYKKSLAAAKEASGTTFNIKTYHLALNIKGDVGQHMFNETLSGITASNIIYKIKSKCKDIKKERNNRTVPVWEAVNEGIFHYYGTYGAGHMNKCELLSIVSNIVEISLTDKNCKVLGNEEVKDVLMIEVKMADKPDLHVVVYQGLTEKNTASGVVMIVK